MNHRLNARSGTVMLLTQTGGPVAPGSGRGRRWSSWRAHGGTTPAGPPSTCQRRPSVLLLATASLCVLFERTPPLVSRLTCLQTKHSAAVPAVHESVLT